MDIVRVFAPAKDNWNVLYVELGSEYQADSIFTYTKVMKGENRVVRWFPKEIFARYNALEKFAFTIRDQRSENKIKTKVKIGQCDLELFTKDPLEPNSRYWRKHLLPQDLPKIELNLQRRTSFGSSPPPGRPGRSEMLAEAVKAVNVHQSALEDAAKALAEKRGEDRKRIHSSGSEDEEPAKSMRVENQSKEKSVSPPPGLTRPDIGSVVSACSIGGTPSRLGLMDTSIDFSFNQSNITRRKNLSNFIQEAALM